MTIGASGGGGSAFFLIIIVAFALLWLIVVRPQRKRQNKQQEMLSGLRPGDDVLTAGGIYGKVARLGEDDVQVEIAPDLEVRVARRAIAAVLTEHEPDPGQAEEPPDGDDERWRSAFDEGSDEEKPG